MVKRLIVMIYRSYLRKKLPMTDPRGLHLLSDLYMDDYRKNIRKMASVFKAHRAGFAYSDWCLLTDKPYTPEDYLNTADYYSLHPLNGNETAWIDDKLTLKYIMNGTLLGKYMPEYYFQINDADTILPLVDYHGNNDEKVTLDDVTSLLMQKKKLAFKKIVASMGDGFIKAEYNGTDEVFTLNDQKYSKDGVISALSGLKGYLVMELLEPHPYFAQFSTRSIGCLRFQIGRRLSGKTEELFAYMRIGTEKSGCVENYDAGGVLTYVKNGTFKGGHILDKNTKKDSYIEKHPDNGMEIKGTFPMWNEIRDTAFRIAELMPQLNYFGIDFCLTNQNEMKVLEINSLTSLIGFQLEQPALKNRVGDFFRERLTHNKRH